MTKKILFICAIIIAVILIFLGLFFRISKKSEEEIKQNSQTIIPFVPSKTNNNSNDKNESYLSGIKVFIELNKDEIFVDVISADLNGDGIEDQIIAIKKLLDPFIYLVASIQNPITKEFYRVAEIKTNVTQPKSLSFHAIDLQDSLPALVYSGISSDKSQVLVIYFIKISKQGEISFNMAADLRADVRIEMIDGRKNLRGTLNDYSIHTYNFDPYAPDTLNQIKSEYKWNDSTSRYVKINEVKIPGEKIESSFLKKLSNASAESFKEFLSGLWYQRSSSDSSVRYLYFDEINNIFIFHIDNIQEIYAVSSVLPRRFGVSLMTNNKSISSIKRRIEIELRGIDEIRLRVVEDVARLKIGTASNWDGIYRKKRGNINSSSSNSAILEYKLKNIFSEKSEWLNNNGYFETEMFSYKLHTDKLEETGFFNFIRIEDIEIIQLRNSAGVNYFYKATVEKDEIGKKTLLKMTPVTIGFGGISIIEEQSLIFEKKE